MITEDATTQRRFTLRDAAHRGRAAGLAVVFLATAAVVVSHGRAHAQDDWDRAESASDAQAAPPPQTTAAPLEPVVTQPRTPDARRPEEFDPDIEKRFRVTVEVPLFVGTFGTGMADVDAVALAPLASFGSQWSRTFRVGLTTGVLVVHHSDARSGTLTAEAATAVRLSNSLLFSEWTGATDSFRFRLGGGVTFLAFNAEGFTHGMAVALATALRGGWDLWLFLPSYITAVARGDIEWPLGDRFRLGAEGGIGFSAYVGRGSEEMYLPLQAAARVEYDFTPLTVGLRVQGVASSALREFDDTQFAVAPYARLTVGDTAYRLGLMVNLDSPYGFAFGTGGVWALCAGWEAAF